mgnify:CR=1 FL=1
MLKDTQHFQRILPTQAKPGDLVVYQRPGVKGPAGQHVVMYLGNGWQLHTNSCGDVAHVTKFTGFTPTGKNAKKYKTLATLRVVAP